jgi:hypothetical protein
MSPFEVCELSNVDESSKSDFTFEDFLAFVGTRWSIAFGSIRLSVFYMVRLDLLNEIYQCDMPCLERCRGRVCFGVGGTGKGWPVVTK